MADQGRRRVVIVGGGFAGLFAARSLRRAAVSVTLIDRAEHHLFQPLLYQCATGILSEGKIAAPLRQILKKYRNVECVLAEVTGIDAAARTVQARRPLGEVIEFGYDDLILAAGVRQSYFGHDEFARVRARDEDDRGRAHHPAPGVRRVRDGGERHQPGREYALAHVRPGRRRPDRGGAGRRRSARWRPRRCAPSTGTSPRRTQGWCWWTGARPRWPRSALSCPARRRPRCASSESSCTWKPS